MVVLEAASAIREPSPSSELGYLVAYAIRGFRMSEGFWPVVLIIVFIIAWVLAKVVAYARKSEQQWREVDKSKLKELKDDDEW